MKSSFAPKIKIQQQHNDSTIKKEENRSVLPRTKPSIEQLKKIGDENLKTGNKRAKKKKDTDENMEFK